MGALRHYPMNYGVVVNNVHKQLNTVKDINRAI